jgi:CelD/BcsL family acetyltransferase involved in cellulose biosynthesis
VTSVSLDLAATEEPGGARLRVAPWPAFGARDAWAALAGEAVEPNPFCESWCLAPALEAFDPRGRVQLAALERDGKLAGVLPLVRNLFYDRYPLPHIAGWLHPNAFCGSPLVAHGAEHAFWRELLAWVDAHAGAALFLHLAHLPADGALYAALRDVVAAQRRPAAVVNRIERAMLASATSPEDYFAASLSGKKRKELRRQFNRLSEEGDLRFERREDGEGLGDWTDQFLALEQAGWKGREGSALACAPQTAQFFRAALAGAAAAGRLERLTLSLDGRPIALLANFLAPPGAFSFKTAYDERLARFSPGVLLQRENLALLARGGVDWTDSCAAEGHPMIDHIWRERRTITRVSVAIGGRARQALGRRILRAETGAEPRGL